MASLYSSLSRLNSAADASVEALSSLESQNYQLNKQLTTCGEMSSHYFQRMVAAQNNAKDMATELEGLKKAHELVQNQLQTCHETADIMNQLNAVPAPSFSNVAAQTFEEKLPLSSSEETAVIEALGYLMTDLGYSIYKQMERYHDHLSDLLEDWVGIEEQFIKLDMSPKVMDALNEYFAFVRQQVTNMSEALRSIARPAGL